MDGSCENSSPGRVEVVYCEVINVYLQSKDKEERQRKLRVTIERMTGLSQVCPQVLSLTLKDDEDPFFIYSIKVSEEDFKILKSHQGLLVDFENFVEHLVRLVDQCIESTERKFLVVLNFEGTESSGGKKTSLQFIERTKFKNLCHLLLDVTDASDEEIKKNMANTIKKLKEELQSSSKKVIHLESQVADITGKLVVKTENCDKIYGKCMEEKNSLQMKLTQQLIAEKENFSKAQIEWQKSGELEKQCLVDKYEDMLKHMENQVSSFKAQVQASHEHVSQLEFTNRELKAQVESLDKERRILQKELTALRRQNSQLDTDYHEKERVVRNLRTRFAVLEQEVRDKNEMLEKQQEDYNNLSSQKKSLEVTLFEKELFLHRQIASLQNLSTDFMMTNEILKVHQIELSTVKNKLQLSTNVAFEQEKMLQASTIKIKECMELNKQIQDASSKRIQELEEENHNLKETLSNVQITVQDKEKRIRINEEVIERLNRRINESYASNPWVLRRPHGLETRFMSTPLNSSSANIPIPARVARATRTYHHLMQVQNSGQPQSAHLESDESANVGFMARGGERDSQVNNPPTNEIASGVPAGPSGDNSKETVTSEMTNVDQRSYNVDKKIIRSGILRKPMGKPSVFSAYFNNAEGK